VVYIEIFSFFGGQSKSIALLKKTGVQNRTNPIEKPQTEPTQIESVKNRI